ncbi:hypothetical protein H8356DRAFT_1025445 [Neocallimastix lanati (nom. inval.)]|uniref:Uncharacterized protein n=1 Tax=Neocallimastix californiae TaxID=1754190 RepID=A0A1Y2DKI4_9FUNG|nr:hypothetical protein H8356DRAFT_1025445 [Neocallimastix sp. JGI-2020a]ORY59777.1 hypothetical protein LY90DRAFT_505891 [Neocallimastix californiae]|eukprot:ORY59777.1 hypothetical protein LY90DRAFT_505891 [Neocallimastix californiae]
MILKENDNYIKPIDKDNMGKGRNYFNAFNNDWNNNNWNNNWNNNNNNWNMWGGGWPNNEWPNQKNDNNNSSQNDVSDLNNSITNLNNNAPNVDNQGKIGNNDTKGIDGNITITIPSFALIILIVLSVLAASIFTVIKVKKIKEKRDEKAKKNKEKEIMEQHIRNYENPYPVPDFFNRPIINEFKDPTEACQEYINTLGRLRYKDPFDPDNPTQNFNFFSSPTLASTTTYSLNNPSSDICAPQPIMVDPQFEGDNGRRSRIQSFSTSHYSLSSSIQNQSFSESIPLIDNTKIQN